MATSTATPTTQRITQGGVCWVLLGVAIVVSIGIRIRLNQKFQAPTILTDELTYSQLAENIANGNFSLSTGYGVVYPLLLAPSWALADFGTTAFAYMQTTNAVLVSLTALPVFLWAKRMMQPKYALLAAGLTLAMPSMAYSGTIMAENAFVLFFALAAYAIALAVERPTILNQGFVFVARALADGWTAVTTTIDVFSAPSSASTLDFSMTRTFAGLVLPMSRVTVHIGRIAALPDGSYGIVKDTMTTTHDVASQGETDFSVQAPPAPYRIVITSDPPFFLTTYGISEPRELGVQARVASGDWVLSR